MLRKLVAGIALGLAVLALAACEDEDLNQFGAEGAHQAMVELIAHDHWFEVASEMNSGGPGEVAQAHIHPHSDVTFHVTNAGAEVHSFALYADADGQDLLVSTGPIPPGESAVATFHFHDAQVAYFQDDDHASEMTGELHVSE